MITFYKRSIKPINFIDALYCEIVDDDGNIMASFKALKYPKRIVPLEETITKNTKINIEDYI